MGILLKKGNTDGIVIDFEKYSEILNFEILEHFSSIISNFIENNEYQSALSYVENYLNKKFEIPLKLDNNFHLKGNLNELIVNEKSRFLNFFVYLKEELLNCQKFYFIVSFIKYSGIQLLINTLDQLEKMGIEGEIITSVYLNITDPKALTKLLSYKNIKVKIYNSSRESFHTKAYLFQKEKYSTCIIGSSNISQSALFSGEEWNIKMTDSSFFKIYEKSLCQFKKLWTSDESVELSEDFIEKYEIYRNKNGQVDTFSYREKEAEKGIFKPNSMQEEILEKLENTRENGYRKGVVVAATGTGKTYLAAMDVYNFFNLEKISPKAANLSFLFIAHREELLENAINVFSSILKIPKNMFGRLYAGKREVGSNMIFASIQSLNNCYLDIGINQFSYIIIDEFHHAAADSYRKIIHYFNAEFLLGLTATPERMDGKNILRLCDYNLVGEIGLKKAMEKDLIAPFHYFGLNDIINYENIPYKNGKYDEALLFKSLTLNLRNDYIINSIRKFGFDGNKMSGIAYCQNINHALYMKNVFSERGFKSELLTSKTNSTERSKILKNFKSKKIEILCVVDIFNEGIDIPNINLLLFLRPTLSSTIFIQQIGRGLRKSSDKDFVTIIDFIGNHRKDYLITKVFSEEINSRNFLYDKKEKVIEEIRNQFSNIPGASYIELDRICQERIINKIERINFNSKLFLKESYLEYKKEIGKSESEVLEVLDFSSNIELFKEIVIKMGSFYEAQIHFENVDILKCCHLNQSERNFLAYMEKKIELCEPFTYLITSILLNRKFKNSEEKSFSYITLDDVISEYRTFFSLKEEFRHSYLIKRIFSEMMEEGFLSESLYGYDVSNKYSEIFSGMEKSNDFSSRLRDLITLGLTRFRKNIADFHNNVLILHKEYMRTDLQILLDSKVPKGSWRAGYANTEKDICLFITNDKSHIVQENLKYDNSLYADDIIQWISQPKTFHSSNVGQMFIKHAEKGINVHIFARKNAFMDGNKTCPFIYLGNAFYYSSSGDKPMNILWKLENKIPPEIIKILYK